MRPYIKVSSSYLVMDITLQSPIYSIDSDECGHNLAVSLQKGSVSLLSTNNLQQRLEIRLQDATPNSIDYSLNKFGPLLAVGCSDGSIRVYRDNLEVKRFNPQKGAILSVAFHPSKCAIAAASLDGTFAVFIKPDQSNEWTETVIEASRMGLTSITWGPDTGSDVFLTVIAGGADGVIRIFKSTGNNWELSCASQVHNGWVRDIASPNVPLGSAYKAASCSDDSVSVLKISNNEIEVSQIEPLDAPVNGVAWAMVDKTLVLSHINGRTTYWTENEKGKWSISNNNQ